MGVNVSRSVEIRISNKTQNIALKNPRTHFFSGHSTSPLQAQLEPGSSTSYKFLNTSWFWGCNGILAYEAESFTLAIYFSNPIDYNRFSVEMALELSLDKVHTGDLEAAYNRLVRLSRASSNKGTMFPSIILKKSQQKAQVSTGPVKVTATMTGGRYTFITVEVEEQQNSGSEATIEIPGQAKHYQEE